MRSDRIVVLAVTKMQSGMCVGGISLLTNSWIRPIKEHSTLRLGDLTYKDRAVMRPFDIVTFALLKPRPKPPHCEDWVCDFIRARPAQAGRLEKRVEFLEKHCDLNAARDILAERRSLALMEPSSVQAIFKMDSYSGKYEARLQIAEMGARPLPVTDIKWRGLGRKLLGGQEELVLGFDELRDRAETQRVFVALGLGRMYEGRCWPLVVGVHTWPDYAAEVDYRRL